MAYRNDVALITRRRFVLGGLGCGAVAWVGGCRRSLRAEYDVIIIGSGFAGIFLAKATAALGLHTLVLEAGGWAASGGAKQLSVQNTGAVSYPVNAMRMVAVGGTSNHWTGVVTRLSPDDFAMSTLYGIDVDWPVTYDQLRPWYCKAEAALSVVGRAPVSGQPERSCAYPTQKEASVSPVLDDQGERVAFFSPAKSVRNGPLRLVDAEVGELRRHSHGTLLEDHRAVKLMTSDGKRIDKVMVRGSDGVEQALTARAFVVAAGVFESAGLLLRSTSKFFPAGLGNGSGHVGRHLNVHPTRGLRWADTSIQKSITGPSHRTLHFTKGLRTKRLSGCHLQLDSHSSTRWVIQPEMEPHADNRVTAVADGLSVQLQHTVRDQATLKAGRLLLERYKGALKIPVDASEVKGWRGHPAGTVRMAKDAADGAVDHQGKVFGVDNLYVSGACTFPTAGTANPTSTVVALSLRMAEHLGKKLVV